MAGYGYSFVTDKGFVAFTHELDKGAWKGVSINKYDTPGSMAKAVLADAPLIVAWKLRATWGIRALAATANAEALAPLDAEWDSAQRALNLAVATGEEHKKPEHKAAAGRVRAALLSGNGTAQTVLSYDQEVDFGQNQLDLAAKKSLAADVKLLGLGDHLKRIREATDALAKALGRDAAKGRAPARSQRVREALTACSIAFNGIHEEIAWAVQHTSDLDDRARLEKLLAPFERMLERYPPVAVAPAAEAPPQPAAPKPA